VIGTLRAKRRESLLLDLGNLADAQAKYGVGLQVAGPMKYDGLAPSPADLRMAPNLNALAAATQIPVVPEISRETAASPKALLLTGGDIRVAVASVGSSGPPEATKQLGRALRSLRASADLLVLVSRAGPEADALLAGAPATRGCVDVIVEVEESGAPLEPRTVHTTAIVKASRGGQSVGVIDIGFEPARLAVQHHVFEVQRSLRPDTAGHDCVTKFLGEHPEHGEVSFEYLPKASWPYTPATECKRCHERETHAWQSSRHAAAPQTLSREGRYLRECLRCHSEYYRRTGQVAALPAGERGVECVSCHGDRTLHSAGGPIDRKFAKTRVSVPVCRTCHNQERAPDFDYAKARERIRHW